MRAYLSLSILWADVITRMLTYLVNIRQGCSKAMMGAITLNSLLTEVTPVKLSDNDVLPKNFSRSYFKHVGDHGDALWYACRTI